MSSMYTLDVVQDTLIDLEQIGSSYDSVGFGSHKINEFTLSLDEGNLILIHTASGTKATLQGWDSATMGLAFDSGRDTYNYYQIDKMLGYYGVDFPADGTSVTVDCNTEVYGDKYVGIVVHGSMAEPDFNYTNGTLSITQGTTTLNLANINASASAKVVVDDTTYNVYAPANSVIVGSTSGVDAVVGSTGADNIIYANATSIEKEIMGDAGDDMITIIGTKNANIEAGTGNDIIRVFNGEDNKAKGNDGNDILTLYGTNTQKKLKGGTGNDTYKIMSKLTAGTNILIDQSDAAEGDKDRLVLAKVSKDEVTYALDDGDLVITSTTTGGTIRVDSWSNNTLQKIVFKDGVLTANEINQQNFAKVVNVTESMSYDSTNECNQFEITMNRDNEGYNYLNLTVTGADSYDKFNINGLDLAEGESVIHEFYSSGQDLYVSLYVYTVGDDNGDDEYLGSIRLTNYLTNNTTLTLDNEVYTLINDTEAQTYTPTTGKQHYVVLNPRFNATFVGADSNTVIDLDEMDLDDGCSGSDAITFNQSGNDLILKMTISDDKDESVIYPNAATLTFKDYYVNKPEVQILLDSYAATVLKLGNTSSVALDTIITSTQKDGVLYAGLSSSDTITANKGYNYIFAGAGNDNVTVNYANGGGGLLDGGVGKDILTVQGTCDDVYVTGGAGTDTISIATEQSSAYIKAFGGDDDDSITVNSQATSTTEYGSGNVSLSGGAGNDTISYSGEEYANIYGGAGDDQITLDWNKLKNVYINNSTSTYKGEVDATSGDNDKLIINNAALSDLQFVYNNSQGTLDFYDAAASKNEYGSWQYTKHIEVRGWKDVPLSSITFVKNGVTTVYTTEQITQLYTGSTYAISSSTTSVGSTSKVDTYKFTGNGWNTTIDGFGNGDVLDFSAYTSGSYLLQYGYNSSTNDYVLKFIKQAVSAEESDSVIGTVTLTNAVLEYNAFNAVVKSYNGTSVNEQTVYMSSYNTGTTLLALGLGVTLTANDSSISSIVTGFGDDTVYLTAGNQGLSTGAGNDIVYVNSDNNSSISTDAGDDIIYVNGKSNYVYGGIGSDKYYVDWSMASGSTVSDYNNSTDSNSLRIFNAQASNMNFRYENENSYSLIIGDNSGNKLTISSWKVGFTNGITFDDGTLSIAEIEAKIADTKRTYTVDGATTLNNVFTATDGLTETFAFNGSGWQVSVDNFNNEEDVLDFSAYSNSNYLLKYSSDTTVDEYYNYTYGKNLEIEVVQADDGGFTSIGKFTLNDFFSGNVWESKKLYMQYYQDGYLENNYRYVYNEISNSNTYYSLGDLTIDNLQVNDDNVGLELYNNNSLQITLNGENDNLQTGYVNDTVYVNGASGNIYTNSGDDIIIINSTNCYINGGDGSDTYVVDWEKANNTTIYEYIYVDSTDINTIKFNNLSLADVTFLYNQSTYSDIDTMILKADDKQFTISNWSTDANYQLEFTNDNVTLDYAAVTARQVDSNLTISSSGTYDLASYIEKVKLQGNFGDAYLTNYQQSQNISFDFTDYGANSECLKLYTNDTDAYMQVSDGNGNICGTIVLKNIVSSEQNYVSLNLYYTNYNVDGSSYTTNMWTDLSYGSTSTSIYALSSSLVYTAAGTNEQVNGTNGADYLSVTGSSNYLYGSYGNDIFYVQGSSNSLNGGDGSDIYHLAWASSGTTTICDYIYTTDTDSSSDVNVLELYGTNLDNLTLKNEYNNLVISDGTNNLTVQSWFDDSLGSSYYLDTISLVDTSTGTHMSKNYTHTSIDSALSAAITSSIAFGDSSLSCSTSSIEEATYNDTLSKLNITGNV